MRAEDLRDKNADTLRGMFKMEDKFKKIDKETIKEGDLVQFCGFYILKARKLTEAGFEPDCFFIEEETTDKEKNVQMKKRLKPEQIDEICDVCWEVKKFCSCGKFTPSGMGLEKVEKGYKIKEIKGCGFKVYGGCPNLKVCGEKDYLCSECKHSDKKKNV